MRAADRRTPIGFVLCGQSRSGTTLVAELASSHPAVECDGELLSPDWGYVRNPWLRHVLIRYPYPYLERRRRRAAGPAYGFKLMFYHLAMPQAALRRLVHDGWRLIHVRRRNRLQQSLSKLIAAKTDHWHRRPGQPPPTYRVHIGAEELNAELATRAEWTRAEEAALADLPRLTVVYEDDLAASARWQETMSRVFEYIGVTPAPVHAQLLRTDERDYGEIIENYAELLASVRKGPHGEHLGGAG